jgi:hypothetical protein
MKNHRFLLVNNKQGLGRFSKNNDFVVVDLLPCPYQPFSHPNSSSSTAPTSRSFSLSLPALVPACPTVRVQQGPGYRSDSLKEERVWRDVVDEGGVSSLGVFPGGNGGGEGSVS